MASIWGAVKAEGASDLDHTHERCVERRYVVIALFQKPDGRVRYLIQSEDEPSEYTASAKELRKAPGPR